MSDLKTYKLKRHAGIDDLEGMIGDMATEWWTDLQWAEWNADEPNRKRRNEERIAQLKKDGEYGKEYEIGLSFIPHPLFDEPESKEITCSHSFFIFDTSEDKSE